MSQDNKDNRIPLLTTAFVVYHYVDLEKARQFCLDSGLSIVQEREGEIFFNGYGTEPFIVHAINTRVITKSRIRLANIRR